jgi:DNA-binding CsgD family transcriptional regulator
LERLIEFLVKKFKLSPRSPLIFENSIELIVQIDKNMKEVIVSYKKVFNADKEYDGNFVKEYIDKLRELDDHTPPLESFILVTNTSRHSYEYVGDSFEKTLGLDRDRMLSEGLNYYLSHYHPEDLPILLRAFEELMTFTMTQLDLDKRQRVVYTWNYRIRNNRDEYRNIFVQQTPIFFDGQGMPIIGYSQNTLVGNGKPRPVIATCKYLNSSNQFETLFHKNYSLESLQRLLTSRELEVVKLLASSYSTKQIANQLHISIETVSVHRKRILSKLNFDSTAEIIEYCNKYRVF